MKNELNLMIDLETLSVKSNALIVELGAVFFTLNKDGTSRLLPDKVTKFMDNHFDMSVSITSDVKDREFDLPTIGWWLKQAKEVQPTWLDSSNSLFDVMRRFGMWVPSCVSEFNVDSTSNDYNIWSHGSDFDTIILRNSLEACSCFKYSFYNRNTKQQDDLWQRRNVRDTRTLFDLSGFDYFNYVKENNAENQHSALHDAVTQAKGVIAAFNKLHGIENAS